MHRKLLFCGITQLLLFYIYLDGVLCILAFNMIKGIPKCAFSI